jgi:large subunit ribosomal protein L6
VIESVAIPEGVEVEVIGKKVKFTGPKGSLEKDFSHMIGLEVEKVQGKLKFSVPSKRRRHMALLGTAVAHARNAIRGVTQGFTYTLRVVFSHFPIRVTVEGERVVIHNFLGERTPRIAPIVKGVEVKVEGPEIKVSGVDVEAVGEMASRLERATQVKGRDRRRFLDGIYLYSKG